MILSDPPAPDLAETLNDEDRENDGGVMNTTRLARHVGAEAAAEFINGPDAGLDRRAAVLAGWARQLAADPGATTPA